MLLSSRVLVHAALAVGIGLAVPVTAFAELPTAPKLCSAEQERAAEAKPDPVAVEECANLRIQSAEARRSSVPVEEDPEKITPFRMKSDIGVSPETRKQLFGEGDSATGSTSAYEQAATRAYYFTGFFTAQQGGALYVPPVAVESTEESTVGLEPYLQKRRVARTGSRTTTRISPRVCWPPRRPRTSRLFAQYCSRAAIRSCRIRPISRPMTRQPPNSGISTRAIPWRIASRLAGWLGKS